MRSAAGQVGPLRMGAAGFRGTRLKNQVLYRNNGARVARSRPRLRVCVYLAQPSSLRSLFVILSDISR